MTLSPVPDFAEWLKRERAAEASTVLDADDRAALAALDTPGWWQTEKTRDALQRAAAARRGLVFPARAHASAARRSMRSRVSISATARGSSGSTGSADSSERAIEQAHGLMVNYLYDLEDIEKNHEAYAQQRTVVASSAVTRLLARPAREVVPVAVGASGRG